MNRIKRMYRRSTEKMKEKKNDILRINDERKQEEKKEKEMNKLR